MAPSVLALQQHAGNAAVARMLQSRPAEAQSLGLGPERRVLTSIAGPSLQRFKVNPMPRVRHQWNRKHRLVDLNCGWYAQMGVVDYHYLKSIRPKLTPRQRVGLESDGHLGYHAAKGKLHHHSKMGFDPEYRAIPGADRAAISEQLGKPNTPDQWKDTLKKHGPLIVSKASHFVLVVGVTARSFYYLDSLTGLAAYHDFFIMNRIIEQVYRVRPSEVEKLFQAELDASEDERKQAEEALNPEESSDERSDDPSGTAAEAEAAEHVTEQDDETSDTEEKFHRPREREARSDETSVTAEGDETTSTEGTSSGE
jgi:hypothetical protein